MVIFVVFTFAILYMCNFFTNLPIVAGEPTEQSGKHALSSFCEVMMMKKTAINIQMGPAMMTDAIHDILLVAASNYPFIGTKSVVLRPFDDLKKQLLATAFGNLLLKFPIMEDVNNILFDSAWDACHKADYSGSTPKDEVFKKISDIMIQKIESTILANASLAPLYKEEKSKAEKIPLPAVLSDAEVDISANPRYLDFATRKRVLRYALKPCYELARLINGSEPEAFRHHYLSQAVLQLAKTDKVNRIQPIFDEATKIAGENYKLQASAANRRIAFFGMFFSTLEEKLMKDPELDNVRMTVKNDLTKKYGI